MLDTDEEKRLTQDFLARCESIFNVAQSRSDTTTALGVARSAFSVAIASATTLEIESARLIASEWYDRLVQFYAADTANSRVLAKYMRQATLAMQHMLAGEDSELQDSELQGGTSGRSCEAE